MIGRQKRNVANQRANGCRPSLPLYSTIHRATCQTKTTPKQKKNKKQEESQNYSIGVFDEIQNVSSVWYMKSFLVVLMTTRNSRKCSI